MILCNHWNIVAEAKVETRRQICQRSAKPVSSAVNVEVKVKEGKQGSKPPQVGVTVQVTDMRVLPS